jgi:hypothetical protein
MAISPKLPLSTQLELDSPTSPPQDSIFDTPSYKESSFRTAEVEDSAKNSLDFLAALALPTVFKYLFPAVFQGIWTWLLSYVHKTRDFSQLAIGLPRGFGKTMLIKIFVLYCILFTKKQFILIICGTQTKANNVITDIISMLSETNIKRVFGDWQISCYTDRQDLKRFGFRGRNIILMGAGAEADIRGITLENARPDVMIFDDIQTRADADSEIVSTNLETWMFGTAMKAKSPEGCLFVFIANMYPTKWSLLRRLKHNPTWMKFIAGGILADGTSLWEDLQPIAQLLREFENDLSAGRPEIFYAEVLNDENASVNTNIDISKIPICPFEQEIQEGGIHQGNYIIIDPATDKANADAVSIGYFEIWDGRPVCKEIIEGKLSPGDSIRESLKLCFKYNCTLIAVESNAYQYSYLYWHNFSCQQMGIIGINCVDIYSGQKSKNSRILEMFKALLAGEIYLLNAVRPQVFSQVTSFNYLKTNNTDGILDLLTYSQKVIELYGEYITSGLTINLQDFGALRVRSEVETSPF